MTPSSSYRQAVEVSGGAQSEPAAGAGGRHSGVAVAEVPALSAEPLDVVGLLSRSHHPGAGAVVLFSGEVRNSNKGQAVLGLEYEAYGPLAETLIAEILAEAREKWKLHIAVAQHRVGRVAVGDSAVVVITASAHRSEAYAANRYIIDRIKHEAPIWKCEHYADGTKEWGNNCNCHATTGDIHKHIYESDPTQQP